MKNLYKNYWDMENEFKEWKTYPCVAENFLNMIQHAQQEKLT
jgi:hypothetical protein